MTPSRIAELRVLAGAATPGPWTTSSEWSVRGPDDDELLAACSYHNHAADAEYIAAACNELPAALDEIERLRTALTRIRDEWPRCIGHVTCYRAHAGVVMCETCGKRWSDHALDVIEDALNGAE